MFVTFQEMSASSVNSKMLLINIFYYCFFITPFCLHKFVMKDRGFFVSVWKCLTLKRTAGFFCFIMFKLHWKSFISVFILSLFCLHNFVMKDRGFLCLLKNVAITLKIPDWHFVSLRRISSLFLNWTVKGKVFQDHQLIC